MMNSMPSSADDQSVLTHAASASERAHLPAEESSRQVQQDAPNASAIGWWWAPIGYLCAGALVLVASFWSYHTFFAYKPMRLAVLDINFIMEAKELEFTAILSKPGVTDEDRKKALDLVAKIEPDLKRVLEDVRKECGCEILVKAAAISSDHITDITRVVADRMKISDETLLSSKKQLREALQAGTATAGKSSTGAN